MLEKYNNLESAIDEIKDWYRSELKSISAGVANPAVLDSVYVDSYGSRTQIAHVAAINIEDAKTLKIVAWDKSQNKIIEQAIRDADLGLSLVTDSDCIRAISPQLTTETRAKYAKIAKTKHEDARIKIRSVRQDVNSEIDEAKKSGELSEDDQSKRKDDVQGKIDSANRELDALLSLKEEAIMKV